MVGGSAFSVVITSYGVGRRIERAVESILNQTLGDIELVVVDDGSEDEETVASLNRLAGAIRIERTSGRKGAGAARNLGLSATEQPYVLCLDGDDWVEPRYLELARDIFLSRPEVGIVSAWVRFEGGRQGEWRPEEFSLEDLLAGNRISSASTYRRAASEAAGLYAEDLGGFEDWEHWISIAAEGWKTHIIPEVLSHYDWRPNGLGTRSNARARELVEKIVSKHRGLFQDNVGMILAAKHEKVVVLEVDEREAWKRGEDAEAELQRVWNIVGELGAKLEAQDRSFNELVREIERTRQRVQDLEEALAQTAACQTTTDGSQP